MGKLQDSDLLLINRAGVDYKCTFADWKTSQVGIDQPHIVSPHAGATDLGETPTFTSSAFSGAGTTHASSDWQVTLKTDAAFAAPVVQTTADAAHKLSWDGGPLQPNTDYIVRVRYNGTGGVVSAWSPAVGFKTKSTFILATAPGDAWSSVNGAALTAITAPVKLINLATSNGHLYGVGVDGNVYSCRYTATAMTKVPYPRGNIVQVAPFYDASGGVSYTVVLGADGFVWGYDGGGTEHGITGASVRCKAIMSGGGVSDSVAAIGIDGSIYVFATAEWAGQPASLGGWIRYNFTLPGGRVAQKVASTGSAANYTTDGIVVLATDGTLWAIGPSQAPGIPSSGTRTNPFHVSPGILFKEINNISAACGGRLGLSALSTTHKIWYAALANESNSGVQISWNEQAWGTGFKENVYAPYNTTGPVYGLKDDGFLYCAPRSSGFSFVKVPGQSTQIPSLGNIRSATQLAAGVGFVIIP